MREQLYKKNDGYKKIYPLNFLKYILSDDTKDEDDGSQISLNILINHIYVEYNNNAIDTKKDIPATLRKKGLWITYLDYRNYYITECYKGEELDDEAWSDDNNWEIIPDVRFVESATMRIPDEAILPNHLSPALQELILNSGHVTNLPDDEDLEQVAGVLKLKNRSYNEYLASGKGYKILRKNWINSKNILTAADFNQTDTIYEVRYDFDLQGATIVLPRNCDLSFTGGHINNGSITFDNGRPLNIIKFEDAGDATFNGKFTKGLIITFEEDGPMWFDGNEWSKIAGSLEPTADVVSVQETDVPQASVVLSDKGEFKFSFGLPRGPQGEQGPQGEPGLPGLDGKPGQDGRPGVDAVGGRTVFAFISSKETPSTPLGGYWDMDTNVVIPPDGWSNTTEGLNVPIWMSTGLFGSDGRLQGNWSTPIKVTGDNGEPGTDGLNLQFIYKLTANSNVKPPTPTGYPKDDYNDVPEGWSNHPNGVNEEMRCEWMSFSSKDLNTGIWSAWSEPAPWSNYGVNGADGDGLKYAFKTTTDSRNPGQPEGSGDGVEAPKGWNDEPTGVDKTNKYEWVTVSKFRGESGTWDKWSIPTLWAKYADNGENGNSIEVRYAKTSGSDDVPLVVKNDRNPGSIWGLVLPTRTDRREAVWGIQTLVKPNNSLYQEWSDPYLITGVDGMSATPVNYKTYVYKLSDKKPESPTGTDPNNPGNGWVDYPDSVGNWWQCIGDVDGQTASITKWGEVLPLNGRDGAAQDGKRTEFRFAIGVGDSAPYLYKNQRHPSGWETQPPAVDITQGETLWMTNAVINGDDTLFTDWTDAVRISGEQGPKGDTGPAGPPGPTGSQGISGIPGKYIEVRYCRGTAYSYTGTSNPGSERYPSGWSTSVPNTSGSYPYIWFIQATINFSGPDDNTGTISGSWSTPTRLSGLNGINGSDGSDGADGADGAPGPKGQVVYPAGIYSLSTTYVTDDNKAPYVLDTNTGQFYVLNTKMSWRGYNQGNKYPNQSSHWVEFTSFEAIYAKIGIIANGLIGSAVFNGDFMFSQQGINSGGGISTDYDNFNPSNPFSSSNSFRPNVCINYRTGEAWFAAGKVNIKPDGSGKLANGNISWNTSGDVSLNGYITTNSGKISGFTISNNAITYTNGNNKIKIANNYITTEAYGKKTEMAYNGITLSGESDIRFNDISNIKRLQLGINTSAAISNTFDNSIQIIETSYGTNTINLDAFAKKGSVIFFKKMITNNVTLKGTFVLANLNIIQHNFVVSDYKPRIFIYDGYHWYEFLCGFNG